MDLLNLATHPLFNFNNITEPLISPEASDPLINAYRQDLFDILTPLLADRLTEHQYKVFTLWLHGKTQYEIAEHLGILQNAVSKCLFGNIQYSNRVPHLNGRTYGGIMRKLMKLVASNMAIQRILGAIRWLRGNGFAIPCDNEVRRERKEPQLYKTNTIGVRGVNLHPQTGKYQARITYHGKRIYLGLHKTIAEAAKAYQDKANELRKR